MTQQPYYGTPADPYAPQGAQQYPPPGYAPAPNGYAPAPQPSPYAQQPAQTYGPPQGQQPGYGYTPQQFGQQAQAPAHPPLPAGTIDDFFNQPTSGTGKGLSWNQKPDGYTYVSVCTKTPADTDVFVDTHPANAGPLAGTPKTNRDGSHQLVLPVQLRLIPTDDWQRQTYLNGEAQAYLRGGLRTELVRAMAEVGDTGVPKEGSLILWTITHRKPGRNIATNVYRVVYRLPGTWESDPQYAWIVQALNEPQTQQPAPQQYGGAPQGPYQPQLAQAPVQGVQGYGQATPNPQQYAAPQYGQGAYAPTPQYAQPDSQPTVAAPAQPAYNFQQAYQASAPQVAPNPQAAPVQDQLPMQYGPAQPGVQQTALDPGKQDLLNRLAANQQPGAQQGQAPQHQQ